MILLGVPCSVVSEVCVVQTFVFKVFTATLRRSKPYTASVRKTIHEAEHKPYILFLNTNLANGI